MLDIEKYMESFKESITIRFEKLEENFKNKMESFEETLREYTKRLSRLEDQRNADENEEIELQQVKNLKFSSFLIFCNFKTVSSIR